MENYSAASLTASYTQEYEDFCRGNDEFTPSQRLTNFYVKNIENERIFMVYNKVVTKIVHNIATVQNLLDIFKQKSHLDKVILLDVYNMFVICGDSDPMDQNYFAFFLDASKYSLELADTFSDLFDKSFSSHMYFNHKESVSEVGVACVKGLNKYTALVYVMRAEIFQKRELIDYNFNCVRKGIKDVMKLYTSSTGYLDSSDFELTKSYKILNLSDKIYSL